MVRLCCLRLSIADCTCRSRRRCHSAAAALFAASSSPLTKDRLDPGDVLAGLAELAGVFQLLGHRLAAQVEQMLLLLSQLVLEVLVFLVSRISLIFIASLRHSVSLTLPRDPAHLRHRVASRRRTGVGTGILWATRARARLAVGSSTPVISNITVPGLHDRHPVFRLALALAHAGFQRLAGDRLVREDPDEHAAFATKEVAARDAAGFDLPGRDPRRLPATAGRTRRTRRCCRGWRCPSSSRAGFCGTSPAWASLA